MKNFLFLFLLFINSLSIFGKEIIKYEGKKLNISRKVFILEDQTKSFEEKNIIKGLYDEKFKLNKDNLLYLESNNSTYYIKIQIKNSSDKKYLSLYGWFSPLILSRTGISIISIENDGSIINNFITQINEQDKEGLLNYGQASFIINPNETRTIYIKTNSNLITPLILTTLEDIIKEERFYLAISHIFNGISLIILLIIFSFYLKLRKKYLLYYVLLFIFTYLKSGLFLKFARKYLTYINLNIYMIYCIMVIFYIFFLINFVIDILNLSRGIKNIKLKNYLNSVKYTAMVLGCLYLLGMLNYSEFIKLRGYIYLTAFTLILYTAIRRYSEGWLYKAFFFSWLPQWFLYVYISSAEQLKMYTTFSDIRVIEYLEVFTNLFLIAGILVYDAKELWKDRNTVEDQEEFIKIINGTDNLMHGLLTLIHAYKHDINFDRVMFFRRKIDRENEEILYYDFSIPLTLYEREKEKKYFDLAKHLREDKFNEYYICDDIPSNELYKPLLPEYKSLIALRLKFVEGGDLGYILILNENNVEYEYNEIMKDFKYKSSLLVQYFKTIDDIRDKYGSVIVEETLRNFHIEVLRDAEKDVSDTLNQLDKIKTISDKYVESNDPSVKRVLNLFYDNLKKLMINIKKDLIFDNPNKRTKKKIIFTYSIIEEMLNYLMDMVRKSSNKVNINIDNQVYSDYELFGHIKIVRSLINHLITYLYDKIIKHNIESDITITSTLEEGKLKIDIKVGGLYIELEKLRKEYNVEVHRVLLNSIRSKIELKSDDNNIIHIIYYLNLLTKEEKKNFNIEHLDYDDIDELNENSESSE